MAKENITPPLAKGISEDGWIMADFSTTLGRSKAGDVVIIKGHFPYLPGFDTGGIPVAGQVAEEPPVEWRRDSGSFELLIPVHEDHKETPVRLMLSRSAILPAPDHREIFAYLEGVVLYPFSGCPGATPFHALQLVSCGGKNIDADGWVSSPAEMTFPPSLASRAAKFKIEFPAGVPVKKLTVRMVATDKEIYQILNPGIYEFEAPLAPSAKPTTVLWVADSAFPLSPPDARARSFRILSIQYVN